MKKQKGSPRKDNANNVTQKERNCKKKVDGMRNCCLAHQSLPLGEGGFSNLSLLGQIGKDG
jgi:hypothetical protein